MYRIAICDDEEYFREKIESIIKNKLGENTCTVDVFEDGRYLLQKEIQLAEYDIVFLDIKMQDVGGMEIARKIRQVSPLCVLIFVTSYIDFAVVGYISLCFKRRDGGNDSGSLAGSNRTDKVEAGKKGI